MRICSFLPSATEIVFALKLDNELFGVTHECDYPEAARHIPKLTSSAIPITAGSKEINDRVRKSLESGDGIYSLDYDVFRDAAPDIIFAQQLCEVCAVSYGEIHRASMTLPKKPEIISLDTFTMKDILDSIEIVGAKCGREFEAHQFVESLNARIKKVTDKVRNLHVNGAKRQKVFFVEWFDPLMSSGHWIPELVARAGGNDGVGEHGKNSRIVNWTDVLDYAPESVIVAPCGFGVERAKVEAQQLKTLKGWDNIPAVKNGNVFVADGNAYFSRPGPRIVDGLEILASILNPELAEYSTIYSENDFTRLN